MIITQHWESQKDAQKGAAAPSWGQEDKCAPAQLPHATKMCGKEKQTEVGRKWQNIHSAHDLLNACVSTKEIFGFFENTRNHEKHVVP